MIFTSLPENLDPGILQAWPGIPGRLRWRDARVYLSADFPTDLAFRLERLIEMLMAEEISVRNQGYEIATSLPPDTRELAFTIAIALRVHHVAERERAYLPRVWHLSRRNVDRLRRLSISLGADDITTVDDDDCVECDVLYLGI